MTYVIVAVVAFFVGGGLAAWNWGEAYRRVCRDRRHALAALDAIREHVWEAHPRDLEAVVTAGRYGEPLPSLWDARTIAGRYRPPLPRTEAERPAYERALREIGAKGAGGT
jgi:hypothetical protein